MSQVETGSVQPENTEGTLLGLVVGFFISLAVSAALVISALKAGITPGVSPLVVLVGWVTLGAALGPRLKRFLAIVQVTGSGGAAVTAGVVFTAPVVQIVCREQGIEVPPVDYLMLIVASLAGSFLGFGFVGLGTQRFLADPRLPAPEAVAADRLIQTAVENPNERPALGFSLVAGLLFGFGVSILTQLGRLEEKVWALKGKLPLPFLKDDQGAALTPAVEVPIPLAPLYIGIGALLTLPTALLIFAGGVVNSVTTGYAASAGMPGTTFRWVGGAAMVVAVTYSLVAYVRDGRERSAANAAATSDDDPALLEIPKQTRLMLHASIVFGAILLLVMMFMAGASTKSLLILGTVALLLISFLSGLGGLLSLQVGSSASPVSGTTFMGLLVLSLTALGIGVSGIDGVYLLVPIVVAACVAICAANDSSQDYKTLQLNGYRVRGGFGGQITGLLAGAVIVPLTLWVAHSSDLELGGVGLGDPNSLPAAQASFFSTVVESLFLEGVTPWGPVKVGALLGVLAVLIEVVGKRRGVILSSLAFAVGIYLPAKIGAGIMLGALARFLATRRVSATTHEGILHAAGLITGDAFGGLLVGLLVVGGLNYEQWKGEPLAGFIGLFLLGFLLALIFVNYARRSRGSERA